MLELQLVPSLLNVGWLHFTKPRNVQYRIKRCVRTSRLLEISWSYFTRASFTSNHNLQSYSLHTFLGNGLKIEKIQQKCQNWDGWRSIHIHYYIAFLKQQNHQGTNRILRDLSVSKKVYTFYVTILEKVTEKHFFLMFNKSLRMLVRVRSQQWILLLILCIKPKRFA